MGKNSFHTIHECDRQTELYAIILETISKKNIGIQTNTNLLNLVFHSLDIIFTWFYLFSQLLDLVIKDKFELFQFLILLLQIIYSPFLNAKVTRWFKKSDPCNIFKQD